MYPYVKYDFSHKTPIKETEDKYFWNEIGSARKIEPTS